MKIRKILVPTDFSPHARVAADTALGFAKAFDSEIDFIHAYHFDLPTTPIIGDAAPYFGSERILEMIRDSAQESLKSFIAELPLDGVEVHSRVIMGHASHIILSEAERISADMIVMGTRGLTGLKHVALGSTAERVVRMAPCPVVTVKSHD